jgi:hypothetical protein
MDRSAGLLANRILMLESEEQKILSKIENTRKRADQIEKTRKDREDRARFVEEKERKEQEVLKMK